MLLASTAIVAASSIMSEPGCVQPSCEHAAEESSLREAPSHMFCSTAAGMVQRGDDNATKGSTKSVKRSLCRYRFPSSFLRQRGSKNVGCEAGPTGCTR